MMVWAWPLGPPGETIGSTLASKIGFAHGRRKKAFVLVAARRAKRVTEASMIRNPAEKEKKERKAPTARRDESWLYA